MRAGPFTLDLPLRSQRAGLHFHREEIPQIARSTISKSLTHNHKDRSPASKCLHQSFTKYNSFFTHMHSKKENIGFCLGFTNK